MFDATTTGFPLESTAFVCVMGDGDEGGATGIVTTVAGLVIGDSFVLTSDVALVANVSAGCFSIIGTTL